MADHAERVKAEACCSICLEISQDLVSFYCGHSFCQGCIPRSREGLNPNFSCPQCREKMSQKRLCPNNRLANIAEAKDLNPQPVREVERKGNLCEKHQEALKLFCEEEKTLICLVCDRSKVHRNHSVVPMDEAAREYKKEIQSQLYLLKSKQELIQSSVENRLDRMKDYTKGTEAAKQEVVMEYKKLHEFLEKQESFFVAQLEQVHTEIMNVHEEILNGLLEKTRSLGMLIAEMERMCQQPDCELLKDIKTTLSRCESETSSQELDVSPELEEKPSDFTEKTAAIKEAMEKFQDILDFELPFPAQVTLDPKTANARLYLLEDCRGMWWGSCNQDLPSNPERFKVDPCVMGSRGFRSGWHRWDVEIYGTGMWAVGVAKESVPRERWLPLEPKAGVWALCHNQDGYKALTSPDVTPLTPRDVLQRIRICLDCQEGRVMFFDAVSKARIFAQGEKKNPKAINLPLGKTPGAEFCPGSTTRP